MLREIDAIHLYEDATTRDNVRGAFPPNDTGSTGIAVAKAAKDRGMIGGYTHPFGLDHVVAASPLGPIILGTDWFTGMDNPDGKGVVEATGEVRGGHEYLLYGIDPDARVAFCLNSWGPSWGLRGKFVMTFATLGSLLDRHGDAVAFA